MRTSEGLGLSGRRLLALVIIAFLVIVACGVPAEMVAPPADQEPGGGLVEEGAGEGAGAGPDAIETLAPLPEVGQSIEGGIQEATPPAPPGESVDVNGARWTILQAVELGRSLESQSQEVPDLVATGRLIGVRFRLDNIGEKPLTFVGLEIADNAGRQYTYMGEGLPFIADEEACQVEELEPGTPITCTALYDVPGDAAGLKAVLTDLSLLGGQQILVDLSLE